MTTKYEDMTEPQKDLARERARRYRSKMTDDQKLKRKEASLKSSKKRRKSGKALLAEQRYRKEGRGFFISWANTIKARASSKGVDCNITADWLEHAYPPCCPILGVELERGNGHSGPYSPTLDRIVPSKGYIKENVIIVSKRANQIKSDASVQEIQKVVDFYSNMFDNRVIK